MITKIKENIISLYTFMELKARKQPCSCNYLLNGGCNNDCVRNLEMIAVRERRDAKLKWVDSLKPGVELPGMEIE